ncbi:MAG: formate dehydrogenase accessory sulfurtransferase FdhD [Planctomycetes bacterium]|nr:formate dehydrogenase accessory sulfurtransferase FdhD [Planctomycetota bacterium]
MDEANLIKGGDPEAFTRIVPKLDVENSIPVAREQIFELMEKFKDASDLFEVTGAAHSNCLCSTTEFLIFSEDVARHNAIDKTIGKALTQHISLEEKILVASCRVSKALSLKIARARIPIIASVSAVTDAAVEICEKSGVTLIGFARGKRMNVYTHPERIK